MTSAKIISYAMSYIENGKMAYESVPKKYIREVLPMVEKIKAFASDKGIRVQEINLYEFSMYLNELSKKNRDYIKALGDRLDHSVATGEVVALF